MIVAIAWILAVLIASAILAFYAYEVSWKTRRLRTDLSRMQHIIGELQTVQVQLLDAQQRIPKRG